MTPECRPHSKYPSLRSAGRLCLAIATLVAAISAALFWEAAPAGATLSSVSVGSQSPSPVVPGNSASFAVTVNGSNNDRYKLTVSGLPAGVSQNLPPGCQTMSGSSDGFTMTVSVPSGTTVGSSSFTVTATRYDSTFCFFDQSNVKSGSGTLVVGAVNTLAFAPVAPGPGTAGSAIPNVRVTVQDSSGNTNTAATGSVTMSIKSGSPQSNFSSGTTNVALSAGVATFSNLVVNTAGTYTLTATPVSISGVSSAVDSNAFAVNPQAASKIVFTTSAVSGAASASANLGPITVQRRDSLDNPVTTGSNTLNLASNSSGTTIFASSSGGTTPVSSVTIGGGASSASFYYGDTKPGSPVITVSGIGSGATQTEAISAASAAKLVFATAPFSGTASNSATLGPVTVQRQDAFDNPVTTGSTIVNLASSSTAAKFAVNSGGASVTSVTIGSGQSTANFFYGDSKAGNSVISLSGLGTATQTETIVAGAAAKLAITTSAVSGPASTSAGLGPITVERRDALDNPVTAGSTVVNLASGSTGTKIFALTAGGTSVTSVTMSAGQSAASFFYGDTKAGSPVITLSGLGTATQTETITAAAASKLVFVTGAADTATGAAVSPGMSVKLQDQFSNDALTSGVPITLTPSSGAIASGSSADTVAGVATFAGVIINEPALNISLTASSPGLAAAVSAPFTVYKVVQNGAVLNTTASDGAQGAGVKSITYAYCSVTGYTNACAGWTTITPPAGSTPPHAIAWSNYTLANGRYLVRATATDNLNQAGGPSGSLPVWVENQPLVVTTSSLPGGRVGDPYTSGALTATGGVGPYTWSLSGGTLPAGLGLNASTGVVSGTPSAAGTASNLVFKATDHNGLTATSAALSIAIVPADDTPPALTVTSTGANVNYPGSGTTVTFKSGGTGSFTISAADAESGISSTSFPTLSGWTRALGTNSGTYTLAGASSSGSLAVSATNGAGATTSTTITITLDSTVPTAFAIEGFPTGGGDTRPNAGDQIKYTFSEVVSPSSIKAGWNGLTTETVMASFTRSSGNPTQLTITGTNLGTLNLDDSSGNRYMVSGGSAQTQSVTMTMATVSGQSVVTITLSAGLTGGDSGTLATSTQIVWTPPSSNRPTDLVGNTMSPTAKTQSPAKLNF